LLQKETLTGKEFKEIFAGVNEKTNENSDEQKNIDNEN
jgi:hypothetical protein